MNSVQQFIDQQLGLSRWTSFDAALNRFAVKKHDDFDYFIDPDLDYLESPIFACKFSQSKGLTNLLALVNEAGSLVVVDTRRKFSRNGGQVHNNAIFDVAWLPKSQKLLTASADHTAALLDISEGHFKIERQFIGHSRPLKTINCCEENVSVFATGGRDGQINVWDIREKQSAISIVTPTFVIPNSHVYSSQLINGNRLKFARLSVGNSVTGLIFQNEYSLISCGANDGFIKVWDLRKSYYIATRAPSYKYAFPYTGNTLNNGFSDLVIDYHRNILYANCIDNNIYAYNIGTYEPEPIMKYFGHKSGSFYIKMCLGANGKYILSGSSDNNAYIWHRNLTTPLVSLIGHEQKVTGVGWNAVNNLLVTCSDDLKHKLWTLSQKKLTHKEKREEHAGYAECISNIKCEIKTPTRRRGDHALFKSKRLCFCHQDNERRSLRGPKILKTKKGRPSRSRRPSRRL